MSAMSVQPTDIAIILVSLAACVYCFVLSRRLKALQDTRDGLGATITALSKSIAAMSSTTQETRAQASELANRLSTLMQEAEKTCTRIESLSKAAEARHTKSIKSAEATHAELVASLRETLEESKDRILDMNILMRQMRAHANVEASPQTRALVDDDIEFNPKTGSRYAYER